MGALEFRDAGRRGVGCLVSLESWSHAWQLGAYGYGQVHAATDQTLMGMKARKLRTFMPALHLLTAAQRCFDDLCRQQSKATCVSWQQLQSRRVTAGMKSIAT